jgi:hypothetical protein
MSGWFTLVLLAAALALASPAAPTGAESASQAGSQFFPETGHTVSGRFLTYWRQHGGLAVFGYPLTEQLQENGRAVQYFERQRFELHQENAAPYDVLLGRLGDEILLRSGIDWRTQPNSPGRVAGCMYFELTRHNVCNQQRGIGFLSYWQSHGLEFDGRAGKSYAESLALIGLPLTEPYQYTNSSGDTIQVQWFERARFEWHPNNPVQYRVLLGRLGAELLAPSEPGPPTVSRVNLYFVAIDDKGQSGPQIGCGDSIVPVTIDIPPTPAPLTAAYGRLLTVGSQFYGQSGLYNALYQSSLQLDSASVANGQATIYLSGQLRLGGVCDAPRIQAQLTETARQFPTVTSVAIFVNGQRLEDALSER